MTELISDTVIGAAVGSFITLIGLWVSNHYQSKSKKDERVYKLKSEIFMQAAQQLVASKHILIRLPNMTQEELNKFSGPDLATAKLAVVATNDTVQAVTLLSSKIAEYLLKLLPERLPINDLYSDIELLNSQIDATFQKQNHLLNEMTAFNLRGESDKMMWGRLQENFDYNVKQNSEMITTRDKKTLELNHQLKVFTIKCMESTIALSNLEIEALKHIRKELNMPFNIEEYTRTINSTNERMQSEFSKFLVKLPNA